METTPYIERVVIEGLWNLYDINWILQPDVNILVGENGSGKSIILQILALFLSSEKELRLEKRVFFKKVSIYFSDKTQLEGKPKTIFLEGNQSATIPVFEIFAKNNLPIEIIDALGTVFSGKKSENHVDRNVFIDNILKEKINQYVEYQLKQYKLAASKAETLEKTLEKQQYFFKTLNRLIKNTNKEIDTEAEKIQFFTDKEKVSIIDAFDLSTGEKQLLIILLTALCQQEKPCILLLDEPEISMHIDWQEELIEIIRTLNPNCQLIIATHSISMFISGWEDKVQYMFTNENGQIGIVAPTKNDVKS